MNDLLQSMFEHGHLGPEDFAAARSKCADAFCTQVSSLHTLGISSPEKIQQCLHSYLFFQTATDAEIETLDVRLAEVIPEDLAIHLRVFCMGGFKNRLHVAMEDPTDLATRRKLAFFLETKIVPIAATATQISNALRRLYNASTRVSIADLAPKPEPKPPIEIAPEPSPTEFIDSMSQKIEISDQNHAAAETTLESVEKIVPSSGFDDLFGGFDEPSGEPSHETSIPILSIVALDLPNRLNAAHVKICLCTSINSGLAILNEKLFDLNIKFSRTGDGNFLLAQGEVTATIDLKQNSQSPEVEIFVPILKSLARLEKNS